MAVGPVFVMLLKICFVVLVGVTVITILTCNFIRMPTTREEIEMAINGNQEQLPTRTKNDSITKVSAGSSSSSPPISPTTMNALNISTEKDLLKLVKLPWTSVGRGETNSFHFFSAYFDDRNGAPNTPAVVVLGYSHKEVKDIPLYCVFKYADGRNVCIKKPLVKAHPSPCNEASIKEKSYFCYCLVKAGDIPPLSVMISNMSTCDPNFTSNEIPVGNRDSGKGRTLKKFSVCVGGPVYENKNILQDLVEFISMSRVMGAELITFYVSREQLKESIIQYILHRYSDVRVIEWKHFDMWSPLHYFGQFLIINDCMYRSMYDTEYLVQIDVDEMIIPTMANSWSEMVQDLPQREQYASLMFKNVIFTTSNVNSAETLPDCSNFKVAKYFTSTDRHLCHYYYGKRSKLMTRPRFIVKSDIHQICSAISGFRVSLHVPNALAIVAHYRVSNPGDCKTKSTTIDKSVLRYSNRLNMEMC